MNELGGTGATFRDQTSPGGKGAWRSARSNFNEVVAEDLRSKRFCACAPKAISKTAPAESVPANELHTQLEFQSSLTGRVRALKQRFGLVQEGRRAVGSLKDGAHFQDPS